MFDHLGMRLRLKLRKPQQLPPYYAHGDVERLIAQAERGISGQDGATRKRNHAMLQVLADTLLHRGELVDL
jgi:site-specific recombinase XerD